MSETVMKPDRCANVQINKRIVFTNKKTLRSVSNAAWYRWECDQGVGVGVRVMRAPCSGAPMAMTEPSRRPMMELT
jgi:hypothetical protein